MADTPAASMPPEHLIAQLDMTDVEVDGCDLAIEMPLTPRAANSRGILQGGFIATLIDVVAGRAALAGVGPGQITTTSTLSVAYLTSVSEGPARAEARVVRQGRRSIVVQVDVRDIGRNALAAVATVTFAVIERSAEP